ncbi:uncharacterized protein MKK02DRAFT_43577 [Dioszegia hungarica]|uniref:Uncharacterized protein n=1 Tax=Dioszegia hungarica TaxID=4972 RepID=A0AA38LXR9_9TREE|nr:uncharacterized protein MKK02DRAFT_43577 [Dioszegia hungarica]KAI9637651.1 hypothetical protein MKK02DRAFT_43577 [Dioszegia hungarica]
MSPPISFVPRHSQPFTLEQAMQLEVDMLVAEVGRLENSLTHLRETQAELASFLKEDPEGDADGELAKAMEENDEVIESQSERVTLVKIALLNKVGEGGVRHMGLEVGEEELGGTANTAHQPDRAATGGAEVEEGMHL